ncbi:rab GTPase-activating protein 1-like isoform X3 [Aedes aegypti]|uniref:Rab-GAP TBC domain-containing protein n=1 Tax=Aedes aegypti TaxID=7159 RepID=A0A903V4G5_AEDAE|nr:rab GTPase-activating protein 1-like isoform X3 [Aedes aegypti]
MENVPTIETSNAASSPTTAELSISPSKADDNLSIKSSDSVTTSGEYEIVPEAPSPLDTVDGSCPILPSPIMNIVKTIPSSKTESRTRKPVEEPKQSGESLLNLSECLDDEEGMMVNLVVAPKKLDAISPILNIEGNGNVLDLQKNMDEVILELDEERTLSASDGGEPCGSGANKACFAKAFQRVLPPSVPASMTTSLADSSANAMLSSITSDSAGNPIQSAMYEFGISLEIKEKDKSSYTTVPRDAKSSFRLRCNTDKEVCIVVKQIPSEQFPPLFIERCFGVLLSPGKIVRQADMQLLDMVTMGYINTDVVAPPPVPNPMTASITSLATAASYAQLPYQIRAEWKANDKAFEQLNTETQKKSLTVAVDLVIKGIQEPVRFVIETSVMILSQSELRIMQNLFTNKRLLVMHYYLTLKESGEGNWKVESIDHSDEIVEPTPPASLSLNLNFKTWTFKTSASVQSMEFDDSSPDYSSDGDEPLLSGTGEVSKECSSALLEDWNEILVEWDRDNPDKRPKNLAYLVRSGIPDILRGTIWQKLANVENKTDMADSYRILITKETSCENVIQRDINRTFPAHRYFKDTGGMGQDSLYKVSKAYAVYDTEVGYCQGLSFIAASLLLHMPEEEAFCVLVALMYNYGLRDMYKMGFESLYLRLYQLNRLMKDQLPDLYEHFLNTGVESHMFASQWFLTLFTARFPLYFVFSILDAFLLDGVTVLFQVALTLLSVCKKDLLELDFEGILKYFRVTLPKKCRSENQAKKLMKLAFECKVKKLKKYELEYLAKKEENERKERELKQYELRFHEERSKLQQEIVTLNEKMEALAKVDKKNNGIIGDYKQIIQRQENENNKLHQMLEDLTKTVSGCSKCSSSIPKSSPLHKSYGKNLQNANNENNNDQTSTQTESNLGPLDPLLIAKQRILELEQELAQTKLAQVEAECKNQDLHHQLTATLTELQTNRSSWQPWFSKTLNSIQEKVVTRRDVNAPMATFQSYTDSSVKHREHSHTLPAQTQLRNKLNQRHSLGQVGFEAACGDDLVRPLKTGSSGAAGDARGGSDSYLFLNWYKRHRTSNPAEVFSKIRDFSSGRQSQLNITLVSLEEIYHISESVSHVKLW